LSSLRFALHHAYRYKKKHIIYVAPYQSIIDQNAKEIKKAIGNERIVLEHHCNIIPENVEEKAKYKLLTENYNSPIIVTTLVQFLNTLFKDSIRNIRRMYSLLNSVIIFDEVQSIPVCVIKLYNLAINFLTEFGQSTVVLCSATQPPFDFLDKSALLPAQNMINNIEQYSDIFKRTEIVDETQRVCGGMSVEDLTDFVLEKTKSVNQVLIVVNTKKCAKRVYESLKKKYDGRGYEILHLSTNMYPKHRLERIDEIKEKLEARKKLICVSTQCIEAGVNLSFQAVIRSLAGLDSIIQAAGRCNRHAEIEIGYAYIVQMSHDAENVDCLKDIRKAQDSMRCVLQQFQMQPNAFLDSLASDVAIQFYYQRYLNDRKPEMEYPVPPVDGVETSLLDLLSGNKKMWNSMPASEKNKDLLFKQAFKTAGQLFEVIPEDGKIDVIVRCDESNKLIDILQNPSFSIGEQKEALRMLQIYTVGISEKMKQQLSNAIEAIYDGSIQVLSANYYSQEIGVSEKPVLKFECY
jgi:CRISPR-associated endonuclease/helicase Cas3